MKETGILIGMKVGRWAVRVAGRTTPLMVLLGMGTVLQAQAQTETPLFRQLHRLELGVNGAGVFNSNSAGENYATSSTKPSEAQQVALAPGNTFGAVVTIRYTKSPLLGAEFNYSYARYTQKFAGTNAPLQDFEVQNNVNEFTLGYVAHLPSALAFGLRPFAAVGAGSTEFKPTTYGGQGLRSQARMTYYYAAGVDEPVYNEHFALRAQFRQAFFLAPDFGQNYLTIKQRTSTLEPAIGIVLKF